MVQRLSDSDEDITSIMKEVRDQHLPFRIRFHTANYEISPAKKC